MTINNDHGFTSFRQYVKVASVIVIVTTLLVIIGRHFNIASLKSIIPNSATMKLNIASGFLSAGLSLWFLQNETDLTRWIRIGCTHAP